MGLPVTILIGAVSVIVPNTLPAFLGIVALVRHLSEAQSGLAAMADLAGITIGTTGCAMSPAIVQRLGWHRMVVIGLAVMIGGNVLSVYVADFSPYLLVRVLAGLGSGVVMAVVYAILGEGEGARALAFFNIGQLGLGWLAIPMLGPIEERFGVGGIFGAIALSAAAMLLLVPFLPPMSKREEEAEAHHAHAPEKVSPEGWLAILSVFVLNFGSGSVYSFLEFMGIAWGGAKADVETALALVLFAGMMSGVCVAIVGSRFGFRMPLLVSFAALTLSLVLFIAIRPVAAFFPFAALFFFTVNVVMAYQFEAVTRVDTSSSAAMLVNAALLGGIAVGPAFAGYLATSDYILVNSLGLVCVALSVVLIEVALYRRRLPEQNSAASAPIG
jgi:predicted MFS family arabinose efflux permease